jgi:hypothetical protein
MRSTTPEKRMKEIRTLLGDIDTYVKGWNMKEFKINILSINIGIKNVLIV